MEIEAEAEELRICSGFKLTPHQALNRICEYHGWNSYGHAVRSKAKRGKEVEAVGLVLAPIIGLAFFAATIYLTFRHLTK